MMMFVYLLLIFMSVYNVCDFFVLADPVIHNHNFSKPNELKKNRFFYQTSGTNMLLYDHNKNFGRRFDGQACSMCYEGEESEECVFIEDIDRCYYYDQSEKIMAVDDKTADNNPALTLAVDTMMYSLMIKVSAEKKWDECVPLISEYTDCYKDNICTGCTVCNCNANGKWSCQDVQKCSQRPLKRATREVLAKAIEYLDNESYKTRSKRSIKINLKLDDTTKYTYQEYKINEHNKNDTYRKSSNDNFKSIQEPKLLSDTLILDLLPKISAKGDFSQQPKSLSANNVESIDFTDLLPNFRPSPDEHNNQPVTYKPKLFEQHEIIHLLQELESGTQANDIELSTAYLGDEGEFKRIDSPISLEKLKTDVDIDANYNEIDDKKIEKREINLTFNTTTSTTLSLMSTTAGMALYETSHPDVNFTTEADIKPTTTAVPEKTNTLHSSFQAEVLTPLGYIIDDKKVELEQLNKIKEKLLKYVDNFNTYDNNSQASNNSTLSLYKIDISQDNMEEMIRRNNLQLIEKLLSNLKKNIYAVLRDIVIIQKNSQKPLPVELLFLFNSLRRYMAMAKDEKNKFLNQTVKKTVPMSRSEPVLNTENKYRPSRRRNNKKQIQKCCIRERLSKIIEVIYRDVPTDDPLTYLSKNTRKVIERVLKFIKVEEEPKLDFKAKDAVALYNELKGFGVKASIISEQLKKAKISRWSFKLRLAYLSIYSEIEAARFMLKSCNLKEFRRSYPKEPSTSEFLVKIQNDISILNSRIVSFLRNLRGGTSFNSPRIEVSNRNASFLIQVQNLLSKSKIGLMKLLNFSKSNKKQKPIEDPDLNFFQPQYNRWDNDVKLRLRHRRKRSPVFNDRYKNRAKNILPKYLQGKVNLAHSGNMNRDKMYTKSLKKINPNMSYYNIPVVIQQIPQHEMNFTKNITKHMTRSRTQKRTQNLGDLNVSTPILMHYNLNNFVDVNPVTFKPRNRNMKTLASKIVKKEKLKRKPSFLSKNK